MRWWIDNEARSAELALIISYPTSVSGIIVLLKTPTKFCWISSTRTNWKKKQGASAIHMMSDKQAAVIYRRVTRSADGFAIMKKQHLSSFVADQGTSMCFHVFFDKLSNKLLWLFLFVFVFFLSMKLHF